MSGYFMFRIFFHIFTIIFNPDIIIKTFFQFTIQLYIIPSYISLPKQKMWAAMPVKLLSSSDKLIPLALNIFAWLKPKFNFQVDS